MRQTRERCCLADAQLIRLCVEVQRTRRADADRRLTELHAIEVLLENLLLVEMTLDAKRPDGLCELSAPIASRRLHETSELHRDRRSTRDDVPRTKVLLRRARDGANVNARVFPESRVLHGDERVDQVRIDRVVRHPTLLTAIRGPCRAQSYSASILYDDAGGDRLRRHRRRQWP